MFHVKHTIMKLFLYLIFILSLTSCHSNIFTRNSKNGDLLFIEAENKNLSGAIDRVTKNDSNRISFDHVALIEVNKNRKYILHASSKRGSEKIKLSKFIRKQHRLNKRLGLYRVKDSTCTNNAVLKANSMLGKPYNFRYVQDDNSYYCSDFIEKSYRDCGIFELIPMNFMNLKTNKIDEYWINYYQKYDMEVPQGKPGTNPNQLSRSKKLKLIFLEI